VIVLTHNEEDNLPRCLASVSFCDDVLVVDSGSTDELRPPFAQKGNSYMALRDITPDPLNNFGTTNQYQYFGLASDFEILSYNGQIDLNFWEPYQVSLIGEYAMNVGYEENEIAPIALNNRGPVPAGGDTGQFEGGNVAWNFEVQFGKPVFEKRGDWNTSVGYRYVESDALLDAYTDSDFGLGGTNLEGFTVGASMALHPRVNMELRWMGANEIAGPPLKSDILMLDFNAKF
jgi:glycosyltransferase involved in cell wall biosynthesis